MPSSIYLWQKTDGNWVQSFLADLTREHWAKPVPPIAYCFVTNIDASFMQQVFYIAKRERKSDIHHHSEMDNLGRCLKIAEGIVVLHPKTLWECYHIVKTGFPLTVPSFDICRNFNYFKLRLNPLSFTTVPSGMASLGLFGPTTFDICENCPNLTI